ncbi:type III secretion system stalk subunit SctO [Pseudomonas sp. X10]
MNDHELKSLHALRQLREQRASSQLAAQRQRCRETHQALDEARERLHQHREASAREAESLYGRFSDGMSVQALLAAQARLEELEDAQQALLGGVDEVSQALVEQEHSREALRVAHAARQRQVDAWQALVDGYAQGERRAGESREEAEDLFAPLRDIAP